MTLLRSNLTKSLNLPRIFHPAMVLLAGYGICALILLSFTQPIPQSQPYHDFADQRGLMGVPNFGDLASNGLILLGGLAGLAVMWRLGVRGRAKPGAGAEFQSGLHRRTWGLFFLSACVTALGSSYYHWAPTDAALFWDRLPFSLLLSSFPALLIAERREAGGWALPPLITWILLGPFTVMVWGVSDDVRLYGLFQSYAYLGALAIWLLLPSRYTAARYYAWAMALYAAAKVAELGDAAIYSWGGLLSGHTLKHAIAALAVTLMARMLATRRKRE